MRWRPAEAEIAWKSRSVSSTAARGWVCAIRGGACPTRFSNAWGRHSSPPGQRAPAWAWQWRAPPSSSTAAHWYTRAKKAEAPRRPARCRYGSSKGVTMARVLVVDDEPSMLFAFKTLLKSSGHEAVMAGSGKEALAHLDGVDAVITDYSMPQMDGGQLLQAVRERDQSLPVVLLTAHGSERLAVRAIEAGAYEYVTQPIDIDEVLLVVERALEARALRVQNRKLAGEKALGRHIGGDSLPM